MQNTAAFAEKKYGKNISIHDFMSIVQLTKALSNDLVELMMLWTSVWQAKCTISLHT